MEQLIQQLLEKIENKTALLGVVGLGYVGLPLAVEKAKAGYSVVGVDIQQRRVEQVNRGENYIGDIVDEELAALVESGRLTAYTNFSSLDECDCVAICVPTPLDRYYQPDISYVTASAKEVALHAHKGMLVVLESTTYPGTTEEVLAPLFADQGFVVGEDLFLAFSPERVDPGNRQYNTKNTPKVVGGMTPACTQLAAALYEQVLDSEVFQASSPKVAEMEKLLENTFRNINIALANEMALLCNRMDIPIWEVIDAAATKPYGFMPFYPGPGLGGHCIPIDPFYLTWKARAYDYHTRLIEVAGEINNAMPEYVVQRMGELLNQRGRSIKGAKLLLLGVAYKADIDDARQSPTLRIIELLAKQGAVVQVHDPYVKSCIVDGNEYKSKLLSPDLLGKQDLVTVLTNHSVYDAEVLCTHSVQVFDTRNFSEGQAFPNLVRL